MSRKDLNDFVHAAEHSSALRRELKRCNNHNSKIISLAKGYGFEITNKDLEEDSKAEEINKWFRSSQVYPKQFIR